MIVGDWEFRVGFFGIAKREIAYHWFNQVCVCVFVFVYVKAVKL